MKTLHKKISNILKLDISVETIIDMIVELVDQGRAYESTVPIPNKFDLKVSRERIVSDNQEEYDAALIDVVIKMRTANERGDSKISFTWSAIKGQRMAPFIAESIKSIGYKVSFDKKLGRFVVYLQ